MTQPDKKMTTRRKIDEKNSAGESKPKDLSSKANSLKKKKAKPLPSQTPNRLYVHDQFYRALPFFQKLSARKTLGLDIDPEKVRYVLTQKTKTEVQVLEWGVQKFPSEEKDRDKALQIALENIKSKVYKRGMLVNVSIFSPEINSRHLIFPKMKRTGDLEKAIYNKNETDLQNFDKKSIWRYEILDEFEHEEIPKLRISIITVPGEVVEKYTRIFDHIGIELNSLISRPSSIQSTYRKMVFRPGRDLVIDIGYDLTQMCYLKNGNTEFVRNVSIGARNLEVTIHSGAEDEIKNDKVSLNGKKESETNPSEKLRSKLVNRIQELKNKQNPVLHTFFSEILRSLAFFQGKSTTQFIERIFITGYGIRKESLMPYLKSRLNMPLFILTPQFEERDSRTTEYGEYFSTLGTAVQDNETANLLPKVYKNRLVYKKLNVFLVGIALFLAAGLSYLSVGQEQIIKSKKQLIVKYKKDYERLNPIEGKYIQVIQAISDVNKKNAELKSYIASKPPLTEVMRLFSNETPKYVRIDRIYFRKIAVDKDKPKFKNDFSYVIDVEGGVTSEALMANVSLINFVNHLIDLKFFKHIELLNKLKQSDEQETTFGIRLYL